MKAAAYLATAKLATKTGDAGLAWVAAHHADTDGNHLWTAFGPTNVAIHELGVHVALGDMRAAQRLAERIDTDALPAPLRGRRSQVHLELATAAAGVHADHLAVLHLLEAERVARQAIGHNTAARRLVGELLARERATPGLRALAVRAGVAA